MDSFEVIPVQRLRLRIDMPQKFCEKTGVVSATYGITSSLPKKKMVKVDYFDKKYFCRVNAVRFREVMG